MYEMKIYESLPPLSPRAGFLRTVSSWKDAALVEFGPEGTMHYAQSSIHGEFSNLFTTGMEEKQIIFGETSNLEDAVREIDRLSSPNVIFVTSSPVSEIIGTNLKQICQKLQPEVDGKIICWDQIPMEGSEENGQLKAYEFASDYLKQKAGFFKRMERSCDDKRFLVLGLGASDWNGTADLNEICRMMKVFLGLECLNDPDGKYSLSDIPSADWILVADPSAVPLAETAEKLWGIPWYEGLPYGVRESEAVIKEAEQALKICRNSQWEKERRETERIIALFRMNTRPEERKILIDVKKGRMEPLKEFLSKEAKLFIKVPGNRESSFSFTGVVDVLNEIEAEDIFVGCGTACALYPYNNTLCLDYPSSGQYMLSPYIPYMGMHGAANLLNALYPFFKGYS